MPLPKFNIQKFFWIPFNGTYYWHSVQPYCSRCLRNVVCDQFSQHFLLFIAWLYTRCHDVMIQPFWGTKVFWLQYLRQAMIVSQNTSGRDKYSHIFMYLLANIECARVEAYCKNWWYCLIPAESVSTSEIMLIFMKDSDFIWNNPLYWQKVQKL